MRTTEGCHLSLPRTCRAIKCDTTAAANQNTLPITRACSGHMIRKVGIALLRSLIRIGCAGAMPTRAGRVGKIAREASMRCSAPAAILPTLQVCFFPAKACNEILGGGNGDGHAGDVRHGVREQD